MAANLIAAATETTKYKNDKSIPSHRDSEHRGFGAKMPHWACPLLQLESKFHEQKHIRINHHDGGSLFDCP